MRAAAGRVFREEPVIAVADSAYAAAAHYSCPAKLIKLTSPFLQMRAPVIVESNEVRIKRSNTDCTMKVWEHAGGTLITENITSATEIRRREGEQRLFARSSAGMFRPC